ncbi:MAG TPA: GDP-mannose 4,6-dehydratase [Gaiellaceae bacterium]|nr:GDP-mannose 4,6-dehydratase [Gaiellaceae bacterium]
MLVTGAGGFIGSQLVERLVGLGAHVRAFVRYTSGGGWGWLEHSDLKSEVEVVLGDVQDADSVEGAVAGSEVVFHLAALIAIPYSYSAPLSYVRTNVEGTLNVLRAARTAGVARVVHTSTSEVYGTAVRVPIAEDHPLQGQSPYSASKIGGDKMAEAFFQSYGLPVATIRPFNTYGPRQSARAIIPTIVTQALAGSEVRLGNLAPTRDLTFVADTVDAFVRLADCPDAVGSVVNIGTGREISVGDLAELILRVIGRELPVVSEHERTRPAGSEVERLCADASRARALMGWEPQWTLEAGLGKTISWIGENLDRYRVGTYVR